MEDAPPQPDSPGTPPTAAQVVEALKAAETLLQSGKGGDALNQAAEKADTAVRLLESALETGPSGDADPKERAGLYRLLASAWTTRAHVARERSALAEAIGNEAGAEAPKPRQDALNFYDRALEVLDRFLVQPAEATGAPVSPEILNQKGNIWTNRGLTLAGGQEPEDLREALRCFDEAVAARSALPLDEKIDYRWGLSAAWMNRADTLARLGDGETEGRSFQQESLRSFDEAVSHLRQLPLDRSPSFRSRLGVAWMNRGLVALRGQEMDAPTLQDALRCFDEASSVLRASNTPDHPEHARTLACVLMNQGTAQLSCDPPQAAAAAQSARECLALIAGVEENDPMIADLGLRARISFCRATGWLLDHAGENGSDAGANSGESFDDRIDAATDTVEEGLALERHWEQRGLKAYRPLASELFLFGARAYRLRQPQFLAEYLLEALDPERSPGAPADSREMHDIAVEEITQALVASQQKGFSNFGDGKFDQSLEILDDLRAAHAALKALWEAHGSPA